MKRHQRYFLLYSIISLISGNTGLKCRNPNEPPNDREMEYAVRQCVRQMLANTTDSKDSGLYGALREWERPHRDEPGFFRPSRDVGKLNQENPSWLRERYPRPNRYEPDEREEDGYQPDRRRFRGRERPGPHTVNQQTEFNRDTRVNHNRRPIFEPDTNFNKPNESRLTGIDPCMIYCVFQELKMLDDWGRLDKHAIMDQMTHKLRDRELRDFLQFAVDDCLNELRQTEDRKSPHDKPEPCKTVKNFAICLEERGKQVCEDWDEPMGSAEKKPPEPFPNQEREKPKEGVKKGLKNSIRG